MRSETALLIECCRVKIDPGLLRAQLDRAPDWNRVCELAAWHGVRPLVWQALEQDGNRQTPSDVLSRLRESVRENAARNLALASELLQIMSRLRDYGVPAAALKGPTLAVSAYRNLALREFEDLDVVIAKDNFSQAQRALRELGYQPDVDLARTEMTFLECNHQLPFTRDHSVGRVELHWGLQESKFLAGELSVDDWWKRLDSVLLCGCQVLTPGMSDLLLFLCVHGAKHHWERLKWVCDLAGLTRFCPAETWVETLRYADTLGLRRVFLLGLLVASDLAGAVFPDSVRHAVAVEPDIVSLAAKVKRRIASEPLNRKGILATGMFHLHLCRDHRERILYCRNNLLVPTAGEWGLFGLPAPLTFLYSPLRPLRLLAVYGLGSVKRFLQPALRLRS